MSPQPPKLPILQQSLVAALRALENQVAREMQRTPAEEEKLGVQKWVPLQRRVEELSSFLLEYFDQNTVHLDGVLVLAQTLVKVLQILVNDLGEEGLGKVRTGYCLEAIKEIARDCEHTRAALLDEQRIM